MPSIRRDSFCPPPRDRPLTWAPPTLTSPITEVVGPGNHNVGIAAGQDAIIQMPATAYSDVATIGTADAVVQVNGGRNVVLIGGHIQVNEPPVTAITASVAAADTTLTVASTAGFPTAAALRIEGEYITYTGTTPTSFTGCARNAGFFFTGPYASSTAHAVGAQVYIDDSLRTGISFLNQTGTVHVEGLLIDGPRLADGIRIHGTSATTVQIQNTRIGPSTNYDNLASTDSHPDCIQVIAGPAALRMDRVTLRSFVGRGILNQGSDTSQVMGSADLRDVELIAAGVPLWLIKNTDRTTTWSLANVWGYGPVSTAYCDDAALQAKMLIAPRGASPVEFCPASLAGTGYVSPGYLS